MIKKYKGDTMTAQQEELLTPGATVTQTPIPGQLNVIRRNGTITPFDPEKITVAITQAFLAVEGQQDTNPEYIHDVAANITKNVDTALKRRHTTGGIIHIETIQDQVELELMRSEQHKVARSYVLYREERRKLRTQEHQQQATPGKTIQITQADGDKKSMDFSIITDLVTQACAPYPHTSAEVILNEVERNLFDGVKEQDLYHALVMSSRILIEKEPEYTYVTAQFLLTIIYKESLDYFKLGKQAKTIQMEKTYAQVFKLYIAEGIKLDMIDPRLADFNLNKLGKALDASQDKIFTYLGLQTLYDRYFLHHDETRFELPQLFFMRVAMGLALGEKDNREEHAITFYKLLSSHDYMTSTPTLFNSGTQRPQLSSCFLTTIPDDLEGIYNSIRDNALLSKFAGGIGNDWTPVRAMSSRIKGTNGKSLGIVPFMNVADATAIAVNQGGKRKGAVVGYLSTWHMDIEEFLELRKNTGDDRRRTHDMNTANWIPDLFMARVFEDKDWTLFSPNEVPGLHDAYGKAFTKKYEAYEKMAQEGTIRSKTISAVTLWRKMLGMLFETGHPWMTFKDPCNLRSPQQHTGVVHSSNLCTEITLNTCKDEVAVCNLGSINLVNHVTEDGLDVEKLKQTIATATRMLDNVIAINHYTVPQARQSNLKHRPVGLGIMGFQDSLYIQRIPYGSQSAVEFADRCMETVSYYAIAASCDLAEERGAYQSFEGSLWSKGILPIDSIELLQATRGKYLEQDRSQTLDWESLRTRVSTIGMRNSNVMAIAPTATISNICGISQSIEPTYQNLFVKSNMSGEFTVINQYLVNDLRKQGLWDDAMVNDLKYYDGSIQKINRIPSDLKALYTTAFELDPKWLVESASRRQKWLDQAQSLNLYMAEPSGKKLDVLYRMAWILGLKTTYYLRSMGATSAEKSTIHDKALNAVPQAPKACAIDDPDCEACQ
jgi:ribonucleoside-diphosphate reductase alpha chain